MQSFGRLIASGALREDNNMSDKKDTDKGWLAFIKEIFVFELIMSVIDWLLDTVSSTVRILRIVVLIMVILGALITYLQT